jgi:hypothetical protein
LVFVEKAVFDNRPSTPVKVAALLPLGDIYLTPGAIAALATAQVDVLSLLHRHLRGDWGDLNEADGRENELAVKEGFRILSAYHLPNTGARIWIITETDRSTTTILLPAELAMLTRYYWFRRVPVLPLGTGGGSS